MLHNIHGLIKEMSVSRKPCVVLDDIPQGIDTGSLNEERHMLHWLAMVVGRER